MARYVFTQDSFLQLSLLFAGDFKTSNEIIVECLEHAYQPEDKGSLLRLRSRNHWMRNNFSEALNDTLSALKLLGIEVDPAPTKRDATVMFEQVKNEILAVGFDEILSIPRTTDSRIELAVALLSDAGEPSKIYSRSATLTTRYVYQRNKRILESFSLCIFGHHRLNGRLSTPFAFCFSLRAVDHSSGLEVCFHPRLIFSLLNYEIDPECLRAQR